MEDSSTPQNDAVEKLLRVSDATATRYLKRLGFTSLVLLAISFGINVILGVSPATIPITA